MRKNMKIAVVLLLAAIAAGWCGISESQQISQVVPHLLSNIRGMGKLRVGLSSGFKPFEYKNPQGEIVGFDVDVAKELASALKVELVIKDYEKYEDLITALGGEVDLIISGMTRTLDRAFLVNFTDPYFTTGLMVIVNEKNTKVDNWRQLNAPGKKIAVVEGTTGQDFADKKFDKAKVIRAPSDAEAVQMLTRKDADAFIYDKPFIESLCMSQPNWKVLQQQLSYEVYSIAVPKGDIEFLVWLNYFIADLKLNGKYDELYTKWFAGLYCPPFKQ